MKLAVKKMIDLNLTEKRVLIRQDLNVPIKEGKVTSDARIVASLPTIKLALAANASVIVMSHLGRPVEGSAADNVDFTLAPVAEYLTQVLGQPVRLISDYLEHPFVVKAGEVVLLENVRCNIGEKADTDELAKKYAALCDIFVMDAFGTAHRAEASTHGVAKFAATACAGPLLAGELEALALALKMPAKPMIAIVGGSKVSTKLSVLEALSEKCDQLIVGGGIANTFLAAAGKPVGKSLCEHDLIPTAKALMAKTHIPLPVDVVVAKTYAENAEAVIKLVDDVACDDMILDIGPQTAKALAALLLDAQTIIWNGPVGVFEFDQFGEGTKAIAKAIAANKGFSIAGGGDTLAAVDKYNINEQVSYISTGGGAFLEYVEGKVLPAVAVLETRFTK